MLLNTYGPIVEPFRGDIPFSSFPKSFIGNPNALKYCGPLIEPFRGDTSFVMPEIFYQASTSFVIPEIFYRESTSFQYLWTPAWRLPGWRGGGNPEAFVFK